MELVNPLPILTDVSTTNLSCHSTNGNPNGSIEITSTGGTLPYSNYYISATNSNSSGIFNNLTAGNYSVYVEDDKFGCSSIVTDVILSEPSPLTIDLVSLADVNCDGGNDGQIT